MLGEIPSEYESKYFTMNPETDDLLLNGHQLENAMIVLIENPDHRTHIPENLDDMHIEHQFNADEKNRWCRVSQLEKHIQFVRFIAIYADGTKRKRVYDIHDAWFVKKDSKPWRPRNMV